METDIEVCRIIAVRYGLPLQFVIKEFHLMDVLGRIAEFTSRQQGSLVFKGGTALNKIYIQKTQRFSEDLDFDLVTKNAGRGLGGFSRELADGIDGYEITEFRRVRGTLQFYCMYELPEGGVDHVRVDIAPKRLLIAKPVENGTAISEFTHASVSGVTVYSIEDLTARKLNALADRGEGKDVYDVYIALPLCSKKVLRKAIALMLQSEGAHGGAEEFMQNMVGSLEKVDSGKLRNLTNPFIPVPHRPKNWEELKKDLLARLGDL